MSKIDKQKLETMMIIRNKFAHIREVETFEDFFKLTSGQQVKKNLDKWYGSDSSIGDYKSCFFSLITDVGNLLWLITVEHIKTVITAKTKSDIESVYLRFLEQEVSAIGEGKLIIQKAIEKTKKHIEKQKESL